MKKFLSQRNNIAGRIVSGHKVAIAEADETNVQQTLDSLLVFPLDAQTVFGGDDRLDVPCFGQSHHVQVVIDHDQLVLQIGAGKAVRFDAEDGFGVRGFPKLRRKIYPPTKGACFYGVRDAFKGA